MNKISFIIVGSGYRAAFYGRIARTFPKLFRALFLCRSKEKAEKISQETGIPAVLSKEECLEFRPDFVIVAVNKDNIASVAEEWISLGFPVALETPAGSREEELLRLYDLKVTHNARITVMEQYHRYPSLMAGLHAITAGKIGVPWSAYLSLAHDYHGASLLRRMLMLGYEPFTVMGCASRHPVTETDSRYGPVLDGRTTDRQRDTLIFSFSSGKTAVYDFCGVQYHSFIRSRHLTVRGEKGEWSDTQITYVNQNNLPVRKILIPEIPEKYRILDTPSLISLRTSLPQALTMDTCQDEFAMASMLLDMRDYLDGGPEVYPLEEALEDAAWWLLMQEAEANPGTPVRSRSMPWHKAG